MILPGKDDVAAVAAIDVVPRLLDVCGRITGMGFTAIARVTEHRWIACAVRDEVNFGLKPGGELQIETTICNEIRQSGKLVVFNHADASDEFRAHPTPKMYGFQSYISVPIRRPGGEFFGTLCAIDPRPLAVDTVEIVDMFRLFADLIGFQLDAQDRLQASQLALLDARQTADLRDQFIAVLGHDLRDPLASIHAGTRLLGRTRLEPNAQTIVGHMQNSVGRMFGLIEDVLDFARGRLGGGIPLNVRSCDLAETLRTTISEFTLAQPDRDIRADIALDGPVACDPARISQLFTNLVRNALTHGDPEQPVLVAASLEDGWFRLAVSNGGPPIPAALSAILFLPFKRADRSEGQGLGLGLFIAAEIAKSHGGNLTFTSDDQQTCFVFTMQVQ